LFWFGLTVKLLFNGYCRQGKKVILLASALMNYWEIIADKLSALGWTWAIAAPSRRTGGVGWLMRHFAIYFLPHTGGSGQNAAWSYNPCLLPWSSSQRNIEI